jgi:hypothetical protein
MTRRIGLIGLIVPVMVLLLGIPASANGTVGRGTLVDTDASPAARCYFHTTPDDELHGISVRAPFIYAVNSTPRVDRQTVGWRYTIQASDDSQVTWKTIATSSVVKARASDRTRAPWLTPSRTWARDATLHVVYRAFVTMLWYAHSGVVQGFKRVVVQHYVDHYNGADQEHNTFCGDTLG